MSEETNKIVRPQAKVLRAVLGRTNLDHIAQMLGGTVYSTSPNTCIANCSQTASASGMVTIDSL